jgi:hypothetical protein
LEEKMCRRKSTEEGTSENPQKLQYIQQQELRQKLAKVKKKQRESYKPSSLSDYERSLSMSHKENVKARRAGKDVAQLGLQSKQSIDPLTVEEGEVIQGAPINPAVVEEFMRDTGLTREQVLDMEMVPIGNYDPFQTYVYGETLVNLDQ